MQSYKQAARQKIAFVVHILTESNGNTRNTRDKWQKCRKTWLDDTSKSKFGLIHKDKKS